MPVRNDPFSPGVPSWADLIVEDLDAAMAFYGELFGWKFSHHDDEIGGYRIASLNGQSTAGMMPKSTAEMKAMPTWWTTYVHVDNIEATSERVAAAGGAVLTEPMDVMDLGRMAIFGEPSGAAFGAWQDGTFSGQGIVAQPGCMVWSEFHIPDIATTEKFFQDIFELQGVSMEDNYTAMKFGEGDDDMAFGITADLKAGTAGSEPRPYLMAWFMVPHMEAAVRTIKRFGGTILTEPVQGPFGFESVFAGAEGEIMGLVGEK